MLNFCRVVFDVLLILFACILKYYFVVGEVVDKGKAVETESGAGGGEWSGSSGAFMLRSEPFHWY